MLDVLQVHSYASMPQGRTAYLSEMRSGIEVLIVDAQGRQRVATVGRAKIETRPLVGPKAVTQPHCHSTQSPQKVLLASQQTAIM